MGGQTSRIARRQPPSQPPEQIQNFNTPPHLQRLQTLKAYSFLSLWLAFCAGFTGYTQSARTVAVQGVVKQCQTELEAPSALLPHTLHLQWNGRQVPVDSTGRFFVNAVVCNRRYQIHILFQDVTLGDTLLPVKCQDKQDTVQVTVCLNRTLDTAARKVRMRQLSPVVVSATRSALSVAATPSSVAVITREEITRQPVLTPEELLRLRSGLQVTMRQLSVRGASGWAYGIGSRVLAVVDDLPLLTPEAGDIRWFLLPEAVIQSIEVVKGASSTLWGAGAMDGVLLLRLRMPRSRFRVEWYGHGGWWGNPPRQSWKWWNENKPPAFGKAGLFVEGGKGQLRAWLFSEVIRYRYYRKGEHYDRYRWMGRLVYGKPTRQLMLTTQYLRSEQRNFFYWLSWDSAYIPFPGTLAHSRLRQAIVDLHGTLGNTRYRQKAAFRFFWANRDHAYHWTATGLYEARFQWRTTHSRTELYAGILGFLNRIDSTEFFPDRHWERRLSPYLQLVRTIRPARHTQNPPDKKRVYPIWRLMAGVRLPWYQLDTLRPERKPVFRIGVNCQVGPGTYLRFAAGEGLRYPTVIERFTSSRLGTLVFLPNPEVRTERGWSADVGIRQYLTVTQHIQGFVDFSLFYTEFYDLIAYAFGVWQIQGQWLAGFRAENTEHARVAGWEAETHWKFTAGKHSLTLYGGLLWVDPRDLTYTPTPQDTFANPYLKYRFRTLVRGQVDWRWRRLAAGVQYQYQSPLLRVDPILVLLIPDFLKVYRQFPFYREQWNGYIRFTWNNLDIAFWVYNLTNQMYIFLPGNAGPPRQFIVQVRWWWEKK